MQTSRNSVNVICRKCSEIKSLFYKKNVVIVGAGPSVNQELPSLKQYRNNITIFATGHIAGTLLREALSRMLSS